MNLISKRRKCEFISIDHGIDSPVFKACLVVCRGGVETMDRGLLAWPPQYLNDFYEFKCSVFNDYYTFKSMHATVYVYHKNVEFYGSISLKEILSSE